MKYYVMSIYDKAIGAFMQPFFSPTLDSATRAVRTCLQDPAHQFSQHPADYSLVHLGQFDDQSGHVEQPAGGFTRVCELVQLLPRRQPEADLFTSTQDQEV